MLVNDSDTSQLTYSQTSTDGLSNSAAPIPAEIANSFPVVLPDSDRPIVSQDPVFIINKSALREVNTKDVTDSLSNSDQEEMLTKSDALQTKTINEPVVSEPVGKKMTSKAPSKKEETSEVNPDTPDSIVVVTEGFEEDEPIVKFSELEVLPITSDPNNDIIMIQTHNSGFYEGNEVAAIVTEDVYSTSRDRERPTPNNSAVDISLSPGSDVVAPVTGTIIQIDNLLVEGRIPDQTIVIQSGDYQVRVTHLEVSPDLVNRFHASGNSLPISVGTQLGNVRDLINAPGGFVPYIDGELIEAGVDWSQLGSHIDLTAKYTGPGHELGYTSNYGYLHGESVTNGLDGSILFLPGIQQEYDYSTEIPYNPNYGFVSPPNYEDTAFSEWVKPQSEPQPAISGVFVNPGSDNNVNLDDSIDYPYSYGINQSKANKPLFKVPSDSSSVKKTLPDKSRTNSGKFR